MPWLKQIITEHEEFEAPRAFWYWGALAALSAVVKDNIWLDNWIYKLYPNIYVMLHADSGMKKGPPISMAREMVAEVNNTRIIRGRFSIQGALKKLSEAHTRPGGEIVNIASAFICSSELTSSIVGDTAATDILTDLYDRSYNFGDWESILKMENFKLKSPTVTMLTATNLAHSSDFFVNKDMQGGYIARTFVIYENKRQTINSLAAPPKIIPDNKKYAQYLKEAAKLKGPIQPLGAHEQSEIYCYEKVQNGNKVYLSKVGKIYDDWYNEFISSLDKHQIKDETGTLNRFGDSVLKVAILLSLASRLELSITEDAMNEAITQCEKLIGNVRKTTLGRGKSQWANEKALIISELVQRDNHMISRQQVNRKYWASAQADDWDKIMESLSSAGIINVENHGGQIVYVMPDNEVEKWANHLKGKNKNT